MYLSLSLYLSVKKIHLNNEYSFVRGKRKNEAPLLHVCIQSFLAVATKT